MPGGERDAAIPGGDIMTQEHLVSSIRNRLKNISRKRKLDFQFVLTRYALERFLYRLSKSKYKNQFVLKGALLFMVWSEEQFRPTKDLDLMGLVEKSAENLRGAVEEICRLDVEADGMIYDAAAITIREIREEQEYQGQRVKLTARLGNARIPLQIDIGFGDVIVPGAVETYFPSLLDMQKPLIKAYPKETVAAEKLQAMVVLGMQNSRMKDFYDLYIFANQFQFDGEILVDAISSTFKRRRTELPERMPLALSDEFSADSQKLTQWKAFLLKSGLQLNDDLRIIINNIRYFLFPPLNAAAKKEKFNTSWTNGGPWN
jgi:predicted nucleotidyltransferase component of viral defense system